jgi:hypothetical protein
LEKFGELDGLDRGIGKWKTNLFALEVTRSQVISNDYILRVNGNSWAMDIEVGLVAYVS